MILVDDAVTATDRRTFRSTNAIQSDDDQFQPSRCSAIRDDPLESCGSGDGRILTRVAKSS